MAASFSDLKSSQSGGSTVTKKKSSKVSSFSDLKSSLGETGLANIQKQLDERNKKQVEQLKMQNTFQDALKQQEERIKLQEQNNGGIVSAFLGSMKNTARDLFLRGKQDTEYLKEIERNNKTVSDIIQAKRQNPDKSEKYDLMLNEIIKQNNLLAEATGGSLKNKTYLQLAGQSAGTAAELIPTLGAGITKGGQAAIAAGGLGKSLLKEGAALGFIGGTGEAIQKKDTTPGEIFGTIAMNTILGSLASFGIGKSVDVLGSKLKKYFNGEKVNFTPSEKDILEENVPEFSNEELFANAGIESPIAKTDTDITAKTVAATEDVDVIKTIIKDKVPDNEADKLANIFKLVKDPDEISRIIDEFDPEKAKVNLAEQISLTDNEKKIATLIKDSVSKEDIPTVSRVLKGMEDEGEILKVLESYKRPEPEAPVTTPEQVVETPVSEKTITRQLSDNEVADALMKKERSRYKETDSQFQANSKAVGMQYSSLKKRLAGDATKTEIKNARKYLESGYVGKTVKVGNDTGVIKKNAFGRYGIDFGDGKLKYVTPDKIRVKKVTDKQVIQHIIDKAKKELSGKEDMYKFKREVTESVKEVPVKETVKNTKVAKEIQTKTEPTVKKIVEEPKVSKPEPEVAAAKKTKAKLSETTIKNAFRKGIELDRVDVPELETMNMADEFNKGYEILQANKQEAIDMALGEKPAPSGMYPGTMYRVVSLWAEANKDVDLLVKLASSEKAASPARLHGQAVKSYDMSGDVVSVFKKVIQAKEAILESRGLNPKKEVNATMSELKKSIEKSNSTDEDLEKLVNTIKC